MIGAIADDFTGGTDVAVAFRRAGLRTLIYFGQPRHTGPLPDHDAVVVALKTRTVEPAEAVAQSLTAASWLREHGTTRLFFKYCSTFDSRPEGNIGPVADALADLMDAGTVPVVPSSPEHRRTQYMGHLFVDTQLLSDSPMRHHPLTPMTDSRIPHVLQAQTSRPVHLIDHRTVRSGRDAIRQAMDPHHGQHPGYTVIDAVCPDDLVEIGYACADHPFVTGAAGLAGGLGQALAARQGAGDRRRLHAWDNDPVGETAAVVLAGSCSARTLEQIQHMRTRHPSHLLDALATPDAEALAAQALAWYDAQPSGSAPLIYSSLPPQQLRTVQNALGTARAATILETAMGLIAAALVHRGVRRIVVAGGETSGAVVTALGVQGGFIGSEVAPGVPWIYSTGPDPVALLLKSGNFGDVELFTRAVATRAEAVA